MKLYFIRTLSFLLLFAMLFSLVSCANDTENEIDTNADGSDTAVEETTAEEQPPMERKDYNARFNVLYCEDMVDIENFFADSQTGVRVSDLTYERTLNIKDYLGVDVTSESGGTWVEYYGKLKLGIKSGDDVYQMVMTHPHGSISDMIAAGHLLDFKGIPTIDTSKSYWHKSLMDELEVNDHQYLGYSDFSLAYCYVVAYNKEMYQSHKFDDPYAMVDNKEWTLDTMLNIASQISDDPTQNGKTVGDDSFGLSGWGWCPVVSIMTACDIKVADINNDGEVYISLNKDYGEKFDGLVTKMKEVFKADYSFLWPLNPTEVIELDSNRVLLEITSSRNLIELAATEVQVGVLPYPLYDSNQKDYKTLSWNGYLAIPSSVQNLEMVGDTTELLMYLSNDVKIAYFEVLLGARIANAPEDAHMLDIIWASQTSDIGLAYCSTSSALETMFYALARLADSNQNYSSFYKQNEKNAAGKLKKFYNR